MPVPLGLHYFGRETIESEIYNAVFRPETTGREAVAGLGPWLLADTPGGRNELREVLHPAFHDLIDAIEPDDRLNVRAFLGHGHTVGGSSAGLLATAWRVRDADGRLAGTVIQTIPAAGMALLGTLAAAGDAGHFARMQSVAKAGRRPAAILFADLEASSPLARRLSTASYFALVRRLARAADQCVIDAGGQVGRHAGDGVVAFFLAMNAGSESAAARACITAARRLRTAVADVAARSTLQPEEIVPTTQPRSTSAPTTLPTPGSPTWTPLPRKPAATPPPSPSATCRAGIVNRPRSLFMRRSTEWSGGAARVTSRKPNGLRVLRGARGSLPDGAREARQNTAGAPYPCALARIDQRPVAASSGAPARPRGAPHGASIDRLRPRFHRRARSDRAATHWRRSASVPSASTSTTG